MTEARGAPVEDKTPLFSTIELDNDRKDITTFDNGHVAA